MKALKALLNQTRKENSQRSREMTRNHEKQIQEMMQVNPIDMKKVFIMD